MKPLLLLCLVFALACDDSKEEKTKKDLDNMGKSVEKSLEKTRREVKEAVQDMKRDSTVKKINHKLKEIGDRTRQ